MKITLSTIIVDDQTKALPFYRDVLGFVVKDNLDVGHGEGGPRWITLASPEDPDGARISLEPAGFAWATAFQSGMRADGVPHTAFAVADIDSEFVRLADLGVSFKGPPSKGDGAMPRVAIFDDTCGNWIMIYQEPRNSEEDPS